MNDDQSPLVSIVTASYNCAAYLDAAVRSVEAQDCPRLEHLVIDGGSTDGTVEMLRGYGDRVRWVSEPDEGQSDAINKGWRRARGEILGWLDADNVYEEGAVREALEIFARHPEVGVLYAGVRDVDEAGRVTREYMPPEFSRERLLLHHEFNFIAPSSVFIRREALERAGLLDESLHYTMDYDLWLRLSLVTQFRRVERFWSRFLLRDDSKTGSLLAKFGWDILRVMEKYFARPDLPPEVRRIRAQARARLYEHAADRVIFGDFRAGRRLYLRALLAAPLSAPPSLARRVAYLYYRDSVFGRTYRGLKGRWA